MFVLNAHHKPFLRGNPRALLMSSSSNSEPGLAQELRSCFQWKMKDMDAMVIRHAEAGLPRGDVSQVSNSQEYSLPAIVFPHPGALLPSDPQMT